MICDRIVKKFCANKHHYKKLVKTYYEATLISSVFPKITFLFVNLKRYLNEFRFTFKDLNDVILEALEVFINHILYVRDLYPNQIFKKRRVYNAPVYVSIYPPLNTYLYKALKTCKELLKSNELERLEILFYKDDSKEYERYKFDIKCLEKNAANEDEFLMDFEEQIRSSLCRLSERMKCLEKLPPAAKFRILIYTTHSTFIKLTHNSNYQEFPWLRYDMKPTQVKTQISLLPLTSVDSIGLSLSADIL